MLTGLDFPGFRKNFSFPGEKIPELENFGKLRTAHRYKILWQQCVSQRMPPTPGDQSAILFTIAAGAN